MPRLSASPSSARRFISFATDFELQEACPSLTPGQQSAGVMKSRRTIVLAAAIPLLTGIIILGAAAITPFSASVAPCDIGALLSGLGFALAGLGLLALTRQKERARTFV